MCLVDAAFEPRAHLFLGKYQSSTVGVVNDGEFFKPKEVIDDVDVSECMANIASAITEHGGFPNCQVEELSGTQRGSMHVTEGVRCELSS